MKRIWTKDILWKVAIVFFLLFPVNTFAQEEVASAIRRYKEREASTGYYEEFEVRQRHKEPYIKIPEIGKDMFGISPGGGRARIRMRLADSHAGIEFYQVLRCEYCHVEQTRSMHVTRANLTCRQCHGGEPVSSINHYYSDMNPIRRHAYVCAKCHEGASASFANYMIHPPNPIMADSRNKVPILFYAFWFMVSITVGTFAVFLPHTFLWGVRELFKKRKKGESNEKE